MNESVLGLDIGTQAIKGIIVDKNGKVLSSASLERGPSHPFPGWVEMDAESDWWSAGLQVIRELLSGSSVLPGEIKAIGVSGLVPCLCPLDQAGLPVRPAILYSDNRALEELNWVNNTAGLSLNAQAIVPKLKWIERHEPEVFNRIEVILSAHNYFVFRLTGIRCMDPDTATTMGGIYHQNERKWAGEVLDRLGLSSLMWPSIMPATDVAGYINPEAARETGLLAGTPVITGCGDTFPAIVGCGAVDAGDAMVSFGTTGLLTITNAPLVDSAAGPHFNTDEGDASVIWGANILSAGRLVRWYRDQFSGAEKSVAERLGQSEFDILEAEASQIIAGAEGLIVLPHWLGRRTPLPDANLKGAILGLTPSHTGAHIYRAILESFAYNIRQGFDTYKPLIKRVVATAGGARSRLWKQIVADVLDIRVEYHPQAEGALGIAFLAAYATGMVSDFSFIKSHWLDNPEIVTPDQKRVEFYQKIYPVYLAFDKAVAQPFAQLADIILQEEF